MQSARLAALVGRFHVSGLEALGVHTGIDPIDGALVAWAHWRLRSADPREKEGLPNLLHCAFPHRRLRGDLHKVA